MKKLDKQEYGKVIQPLSRVSFNNLFARAVIEKRVQVLFMLLIVN